MTHVVRRRRPRIDDIRNETAADTRDPHLVTGYELLAEDMPSVLKQLRPMDISSDGMRRYFDDQAFAAEPSQRAARRARR